MFTAKTLFCATFSFLLTACGNPAPQETAGDAATSDTPAETGSPAATAPNGMVNAFSFEATGGATVDWEGTDVSPTGGCVPSEPMSFGFHRGLPTSDDFASIAFDAADLVGTGETGTFAVKEIRWDNGTVTLTPKGGGEVRVPNRFTGTGSLTVTRHDPSIDNRRLAGTVTGSVSNNEGVTADIVLKFDVNLSCGVSL